MFERIRRDHRDEGLSIRALAERHEVHRRTVRQALANATPPERKVPVRDSPLLGVHEARIRTSLTEDLQAPRRSRSLRNIPVISDSPVIPASKAWQVGHPAFPAG